jgi:hypothetical protein
MRNGCRGRWSERSADFQNLDIGLYPIVPSPSANEEWLRGKSGFKAVQYMSVGVPFVMSPVGICAEMGESGRTHLNAETAEDWYNSLSQLLEDSELRRRMGVGGPRICPGALHGRGAGGQIG